MVFVYILLLINESDTQALSLSHIFILKYTMIMHQIKMLLLHLLQFQVLYHKIAIV